MSIKPLLLKNKLAPNPIGAPRFAQQVKTKSGETIKVGCPMATRSLIALMNMHAVKGGAACHWGGPAALAEIMSALHGHMFHTSKNWFDDYNFVNDAGHTENGLYALRANLGFDGLSFDDLKGFRSIESKLTGHGESHLNPEGVLLSNGPLGSALPQSQGLALADRKALRKRLTFCVVSDGAAMEGEVKESFAAIPGLAQKEMLNPFVMIISDNNTKLSGRISEDAFSMTPTFNSLALLGWDVIKVENGHNLQEVYTAIEEATAKAQNSPDTPVCLWVKTIKGIGTKQTQNNASGGHGYPLRPGEGKLADFIREIFEGQAPEDFINWAKEVDQAPPTKASSGPVTEKVQAGFARAAIRARSEGLPIFSVSSDLQGSTGIAPFHKEYPDSFVDLGVAEANMISTAAGLSKNGFIPLVDTFAQFGVTKGNLPLTMAALSSAPIIALFSHTGCQDAADGASHQAMTYISAVSSIPNTEVIIPASSFEAEEFLYQAIIKFRQARESNGEGKNYIFFVGRENFPVKYSDEAQWKKASLVKDYDQADGVIVATGPMLHQAILAHDELLAKGKKVIVINNIFVNSPDVETIQAAIERGANNIITIEDHQIKNGMGAQLAHALLKNGCRPNFKSLGILGHFGQSAYQAGQLYKKYGLSKENLTAHFS